MKISITGCLLLIITFLSTGHLCAQQAPSLPQQQQIKALSLQNLSIRVPDALTYNTALFQYEDPTYDLLLDLSFDEEGKVIALYARPAGIPLLPLKAQSLQLELKDQTLKLHAELLHPDFAPELMGGLIKIQMKLQASGKLFKGSYNIERFSPDSKEALKRWQASGRPAPMGWKRQLQAGKVNSIELIARESPYGYPLAKPRLATARISTMSMNISAVPIERWLTSIKSFLPPDHLAAPARKQSGGYELSDWGAENLMDRMISYRSMIESRREDLDGKSLAGIFTKDATLEIAHGNYGTLHWSDLAYQTDDARLISRDSLIAFFMIQLLRNSSIKLADDERFLLHSRLLASVKMTEEFLDQALGPQGGGTGQRDFLVGLAAAKLLNAGMKTVTGYTLNGIEKLEQMPKPEAHLLSKAEKEWLPYFTDDQTPDYPLQWGDRQQQLYRFQAPGDSLSLVSFLHLGNSRLGHPSLVGDLRIEVKQQRLIGTSAAKNDWGWPLASDHTSLLIKPAPITGQAGADFIGSAALWRIRTPNDHSYSVSLRRFGYRANGEDELGSLEKVEDAMSWRVIGGWYPPEGHALKADAVWMTMDGGQGFGPRVRKLQLPTSIRSEKQIRIKGPAITLVYPQLGKTLNLRVLHPYKARITKVKNSQGEYNLILQASPYVKSNQEDLKDSMEDALNKVNQNSTDPDLGIGLELEDDISKQEKKAQAQLKAAAQRVFEKLLHHTSSAKMGGGDRQPKAASNLVILWTLHSGNKAPAFQVAKSKEISLVEMKGLNIEYHEGYFRFKEVKP